MRCIKNTPPPRVLVFEKGSALDHDSTSWIDFYMQRPRSSEELREISEKLRRESAELRSHAARLSATSNALKREAQEVRERLNRGPALTGFSPVALRSRLGYSEDVLNSLEEA